MNGRIVNLTQLLEEVASLIIPTQTPPSTLPQETLDLHLKAVDDHSSLTGNGKTPYLFKYLKLKLTSDV